MVGACIMPCGAPVAQCAAGRGALRRPGGAAPGPVRHGRPGVRKRGARGVVLWDPDSHRRTRLSVLDSTEAPRDR